MAHLTDAAVKRLPIPDKGNKLTYDDEVKGFAVRVTAAGARSFVLRYRVRSSMRERTYTIGDAAHWRCTEARAEAKRLKHLVDQGEDPQGDLQDERSAPTMADLCARFEAEHLPRVRPSTRGYYQQAIRKYVLAILGPHTKVADVAFADIDAMHRKITASYPYGANRTVAMLSKVFTLAQRWGLRDSNPCKGVERNYEATRKRYLSGDELARLTAALAEHDDKQAADIIRMLLLSGARRGEAFAMKWADLDLNAGIWTKLGHTLKQKTDHVVPLSAPARQLLAGIRTAQRPPGEYVFPGRYGHGHREAINKSWARLCKAAGITNLRIHDLRHSYASHLASSGVSLHVIGGLLGHASTATTHRYSHLYDDTLRQVTERVGALVESAGKAALDTVVPIKRGGRP
jgi:integrase